MDSATQTKLPTRLGEGDEPITKQDKVKVDSTVINPSGSDPTVPVAEVKTTVTAKPPMMESSTVEPGQEQPNTIGQKISAMLTPATGNLGQMVGGNLTDIATGIKNKVGPIADDLTSRVAPITDGIKSRVGPIADDLKSRVAPVADDLRNRVAPIADDLKNRAAPIADNLKARASDLSNKVTPVAQDLKNRASDLSNKVTPMAVDLKNKVGPVADDLVNKAKVAMKNVNLSENPLNSFFGQATLVTLGLVFSFMLFHLYHQMNPHPVISFMNNDEITAQLSGRDILIVGGAEGIGAALARELVRKNARVTVTGSSTLNSRFLPSDVEFVQSNTSTLKGAHDLATIQLQGRSFDTVVFAGGFVPRPLIFTWGERYEEDLYSAYLSRFVILRDLVEQNMLNGRKRAYLLAYPGDDVMMAEYEDQYLAWYDYKDVPFHVHTVVFNEALVKEGAKRYPDIRLFGVNPGFLARGSSDLPSHPNSGYLALFLDYMLTFGCKSPEAYVRNSLMHILASAELESKSGMLINENLEDLPPKRWFKKDANCRKVWDNTEKMISKAIGY